MRPEDKVKQDGMLAVDHVPKALEPEPDKRRVGILSNGERCEVCVVIGPNQAGLDIKKNLQEARKEEDIQAWEQTVVAKKQWAKELREQADQLEVEAKDNQRELNERLRFDLGELHGPALHYIETWDYGLDDEQWAELQHKRCPEEVAAYVSEVGNLKKRGWWGDITLGPYSANGPGHDAPGPGWNGWGSSEWLAEFFPDGLAPEDIKSRP